MTEHTDDHAEHDGDDALIAANRRLRPILTHPLVVVVLAVTAGAALFAMGRVIGAAVYRAFDGDGAAAATFGGSVVGVLVLVIAIGALLDRRRRLRRHSDG